MRTHRLIQYGVVMESHHKELEVLRGEEIYSTMEWIVTMPPAEETIAQAVTRHNENMVRYFNTECSTCYCNLGWLKNSELFQLQKSAEINRNKQKLRTISRSELVGEGGFEPPKR